MVNYDWNEKIEYLKTTRQQMWNDDYFEFLVKCVWKFYKPIDIVDFGCGYGYLALKLLPLLPEGSTYTGIDIAEDLLKEAEHIFAGTNYQTKFVRADLLEYQPARKYDLAICQSVLRHIPQSKDVLSKMVDATCDGGMVVCIEPNRRMENTGMYMDATGFDIQERDSFLYEHWENEFKNGGRDYLIGSKIPIYMEQLGLRDVNVRVNDFVEVVSPNRDKENYGKHKASFIENNLSGVQETNADYMISARCHLISYGWK